MKKAALLTHASSFILIGMIGCVAWAGQTFIETTRTDFWRRDAILDAAETARLARSGYPRSIHRLVEIGCSSRAQGHGENLVIHCFSPSDAPRMISALGRDTPWQSGLPTGQWWRRQLKSQAPPDLLVSPTADPSHFRYLSTDPSHEVTLVDVIRGISYQIIIRA